MKQFNLNIFFFLGVLFLASCGSESAAPEVEAEDKVDQELINEIAAEETEESNAQKVFYALPSPFEISSLLKASGVDYEEELLNTIDNLPNYTTTTSKALNLGIYGADVSITSIYEKTQQTMLYLSCIKKLADDLGITTAFDNAVMQRLETGKDNKDTLQHVVADAYALANAFLKENSRSSAASLILAGGWIEGVHIATGLVDNDNPNPDLVELIADQRFSVENLILLLEQNKNDKEIQEVLGDLKELNALFVKIDEQEEAVTTTKADGGGMVFGGGDAATISPELLAEISAKVNQIRTKFVN